MSAYTDAVAAMVIVAGGIVGDRPFTEISGTAEAAVKRFIRECVDCPAAKPLALKKQYHDRRSHNRTLGLAFRRMEPVERFPAQENE